MCLNVGRLCTSVNKESSSANMFTTVHTSYTHLYTQSTRKQKTKLTLGKIRELTYPQYYNCNY